MNFIKNRARFILIIIFSLFVLGVVFYVQIHNIVPHPNKQMKFITELLKILTTGFLIYGILGCIQVKD